MANKITFKDDKDELEYLREENGILRREVNIERVKVGELNRVAIVLREIIESVITER